MTRSRRRLYQRSDSGLLRTVVNTAAPVLPPWPGQDSEVDAWRSWLDAVWVEGDFTRAVCAASPDLARQVEALLSGRLSDVRRARRAALAVGKYAIRHTGRPTPFGLFAGVAPVGFGDTTSVRFGRRHLQTLRADPISLAEAICKLEADPAVMHHVEVCVNNLATVRGDRVHVPAQGPDEHSLALTPVVLLILRTAKSAIAYGELLGKLRASFPDVEEGQRAAALTELLRVGLLRSALRVPATVVDPADGLLKGKQSTAELGVASAIDVLLDADVQLPDAVGVEMETAATLLARLAFNPAGTPAWNRYAEQFSERYGENVLVPVPLLTHPDQGLGFPDGFGTLSLPPRPMSKRDRVLLELAGAAALEGSRTVTLTGATIEDLEAAAGPRPGHQAPHLEVCAQVQAPSPEELDRGNFRLRVHTVSRAGGSMAGRFWHLFADLPGEAYRSLPTVEPGVLTAQLSFHPSRNHADLLTRAPQVLPTVVSVGEFRAPDNNVLYPEDLAVGLDGDRLLLAVAATGQRIELLAPTAINFVWNNYTPPLARFLAEISRAACPQVTGFDWGAALVLPFTPALHHRRTILIPARWRLRAKDLPGRTACLNQWADALHGWRNRFRMPSRVVLSVDDQHLPLDLEHDLHLDVLRTQLTNNTTATLLDAPPADADGWIGDRAHTIVVTMGARP
jgi:lantibiotic biosynthesis protein